MNEHYEPRVAMDGDFYLIDFDELPHERNIICIGDQKLKKYLSDAHTLSGDHHVHKLEVSLNDPKDIRQAMEWVMEISLSHSRRN